RGLSLVLIPWVPLVLLSLTAGHAFGGGVAIPLLCDPEIYIRFLFVVPLLALAEVFVATSIAVQVRYFITSGIVAERERPRFEADKAAVARLRCSVPAEG